MTLRRFPFSRALECWTLGVLLAVTLCPGSVAAPYTFTRSEVRDLPVSSNGRQYQLYVAYPAAYFSEPDRRFPTLYFPDAYWDFALFCMIAGNLRVDGAIPDILIVGIGYAGESPNYEDLRAWDLTPGTDPFWDPNGAKYGHAQEFLSVLEHEIMPLVERDYRADSTYRVIAGNSFGGLFATYAALERPGLFQGHIASAPSLWWRSSHLKTREAERFLSTPRWPTRLFFAYGTEDGYSIIQSTQAFYAQAASHPYEGFSVAIREVEGDRHSSLKADAYNRGLRFAFAPLAPRPAQTAVTARSNLINISTRGFVGEGDAVLIAGFIVRGLTPKRVLVRAAGPALHAQGVSGVLANPKLRVVNSAGTTVAANDNWDASVSTATATIGAFPFASGSLDAATVVTLEPGNYTVVVSGPPGSTGIALVEAYEW